MAQRTVLVTGASRGIGLGLVRELLQAGGCTVLATCRDPSRATDLQQVLAAGQQPPALALDVTSDDSVASLQKLLKERGTPVTELINNAGISTPSHPHEAVGSIVRAEMMAVFNTNVAGVAAVIAASGVLEGSGGKVINVSSSMGSLTNTRAGSAPGISPANSPSYRCSKAAVNMLTVCFANQYPDTSFACVHPGWVQTDMGGAAGRTADIGVEESAKGIVEVLGKLTKEQSGQFLDWKGRQLAW